MVTNETGMMSDLHQLLKHKYPSPQFSLCFEVPDGTSYNKCRTCDALAVGCWKSVGIQIIGHEVKVSRSDWLKELQDPSKAEAWKQYCNLWYVVATKGIVKFEELPPSWGLMEESGKSLKIRKAAEIDRNPKPITVDLLAAITRRFQTGSPSEAQLRKEYERGWKEGNERRESNPSFHERKIRELADKIKEQTDAISEFEKQTGVRIADYWGFRKESVEAFKLFQHLNTVGWRELGEKARSLASAIDQFDEVRQLETKG